MSKIAFFRFEASPVIGAGHAVRSSVIADALVAEGWLCKVVTAKETYDFISHLDRFERVDPEEFYINPLNCDLLVIDHYECDLKYEQHFRSSAKKILVIDDLANRQHDCDIILDQAYKRIVDDYRSLVPPHCKILVGSDYVLLRHEFTQLRAHALEKRRHTKKINSILISMGGSDLNDYTLKSLALLRDFKFGGNIKIALGFSSEKFRLIQDFVQTFCSNYNIYVDADMAKVIYDADIAIGAAGSGVWERCCLGLPSVLVKTAENQAFFLSKVSAFSPLIDFNASSLQQDFQKVISQFEQHYYQFAEKAFNALQPKAVPRVLNYI